MISALITIVVLVLGPGLAYGQSPAWLLRACSKSLRASVRVTEASWFQSTLADLYVPVVTEARATAYLITPTANSSASSQRQANLSAARPPGNSRRQWSGLSDQIPAPHVAVLQPKFNVSRAGALDSSSGGAGLHPSVLKAVRPWLRGGYLDGSGAGDPADNRHGTSAFEFCLPSSSESKPSSLRFINKPASLSRLSSGPFSTRADSERAARISRSELRALRQED